MADNIMLWSENNSSEYHNIVADSPLHKCVFFQTAVHYLKDLKPNSILDLGCGPGRFCRFLKKTGASYVLGVDFSPAMIDFARQDDTKEGIQCEYQLGDARNLGKIGEFDSVTMINVLQFVKTYKDLEGICKSLYDNLKPGKFCCVVAFNTFIDMNLGDSFKKYGITNLKRIRKIGDSTEYSCNVGPPDNPMAMLSANLYLFDSKAYEKAFLKAGFKTVLVKPVIVDERLKNGYPDDFWDEYLKAPTHVCYIAQK